MKRFLSSAVFVLFLAFACGLSRAGDSLAPSGLLTDLLERTDTVWIGGLASQLSLADLTDTAERVQIAEIRSARPSFSWIVNDRRNDVVQTAYRFELAADPGFENVIWESGRVESERSVSVLFDFPPLQPDTVYYWRVQTWNNGEESPWSAPRGFRTASRLWDRGDADPPQTSFDGPTSRYPVVLETETPEPAGEGGNLYRFSRDAFGYLQLTISNPVEPGTRDLSAEPVYATVRLGERLRDGQVDRNPAGSTRYREYRLNLLAGTQTYRIKNLPDRRNTSPGAVLVPDYIGELLPFRYAEVEFSDPAPRVEAIRRYAAHYPFDESASFFRSDSDVLNQVWDLCRYSMKATSFAGIFVDGDRERIPYEGDAFLNQLGYYSVDREYSLARLTQDYLLFHPTWPTEWILQSVCMAWYDWLWTGDARFLERRYDDLKAKALLALAGEDGLISTAGEQPPAFLDAIHSPKDRIRDIVDWPHRGLAGNENAESGETDGFVFTDKNVVVNAYHYLALTALCDFARILGKAGDAEQFEERRARFAESFRRTFWDADRGVFRDGAGTEHASLHGNMFPLAFGLVPEEDRDRVAAFIKSRGMKCSVYGSQFLLDALYRGSDGETPLRYMTDTGRRSWYNMIRAGSTISLEAWDDIYKPNQDWNHAWGAAPANIIPRCLAGVKPLSPGFAEIQIKPQTASLREVDAVVPTIRGPVSVSVRRGDESYTLETVTPANTRSEVSLPHLWENQTVLCDREEADPQVAGGFCVISGVGSGRHSFEIRPAR
ncbi:MAG: hypothetical protein IJG60_05215 [Thermoguttaceae bacterium]|nr:hypothetical protein [Thermoguttaceae bacterium]